AASVGLRCSRSQVHDFGDSWRAQDSVDEGAGHGAVVLVGDSEGGVELREAAADGGADDPREEEGGDDAHDERRLVAEALAQLLGGDDENDAHVASRQSRRALPVRWRNTASRSGSTTSTPVRAAPAMLVAA